MGSELQSSEKIYEVRTSIRDYWEFNGESHGKYKWYFSLSLINGRSMEYHWEYFTRRKLL